MPLLLQHHPPFCKSLPPLQKFKIPQNICISSPKTLNPFQNLVPITKFSIIRNTHVLNCSNNEVIDEFTTTRLPHELQNEVEKLELLGKPSPVAVDEPEIETECVKINKEEALEPFYRFFRGGYAVLEESDSEDVNDEKEEINDVSVDYYDPKSGDFVVGVVVSGNKNKLDVNIGADSLAIMLTKEVLPLYDKELDSLLCGTKKDSEEFMVKGKMGIVRNEEALSHGPVARTGGPVAGTEGPVVEPGTVLFAEVLGRTLSGKPLLSTRRLVRRLAWHRVRQIKQLNEPIEVKIMEWNTSGLLTRIEGLRAFLPNVELISRIDHFTRLKENVGRRICVHITQISEATNDLIISEKEAWNAIHLTEGTLLEGTVMKIFPYGAQIRIGETIRSGLLHISNITRAGIVSASDLLAVDEKVKVLVVKSMFPDKISLSTAELESEPGLFISNKQKVFSEAVVMAKKYKEKLPAISATKKLQHIPSDALRFQDEENMYANWKWFKFERGNEAK